MKYTAALIIAAASALLARAAPLDERAPAPPKVSYYQYDDALGDGTLLYSGPGQPLNYELVNTVAWTHLTNQGYGTNNKTLSYTGVNGEVRIALPDTNRVPNPNQRYSVEFYSTKKADRGGVSLYCGKQLIATGDQHASGAETKSQLFLKKDTFPCESGYLVLKNDRGAKYMAFDYMKVNDVPYLV